LTPVGRVAAEKKSEKLLKSMISPEQYEDWRSNRAFDVRGSDSKLYRVVWGGPYNAMGIINQMGIRSNVWPHGLGLPADSALGMMLYLVNDAPLAWRTGCHDHYHSNRPTGKYL
jgi:hypothetical protein